MTKEEKKAAQEAKKEALAAKKAAKKAAAGEDDTNVNAEADSADQPKSKKAPASGMEARRKLQCDAVAICNVQTEWHLKSKARF